MIAGEAKVAVKQLVFIELTTMIEERGKKNFFVEHITTS